MAIDRNKITHAVMEGSKIRESKGIIPLFGVYLSLFSVNYYNKLSYDFEKRMGAQRRNQARNLLIAAAQESAYATFQGLRNSYEWEQLVSPMIETEEDQIRGFAAVAVAFGWGDLEVKEIVPGQSLRIRARDSYQARGIFNEHGLAESAKCYMLRGVTAAFMDLIYGGNYPEGCFTFSSDETQCQAKGDSFCEFIARKPSHRTTT